MKVSVEKLTDVNLLRRANEFTTGNESKMSLAKAYRYGHSPIRTQMFWVELTDIPLFVASQMVRSHVGIQFFQRSKRTDRGGEDFKTECDIIAGDVFLANDRYFAAKETFGKADDGAENVIQRLESVGWNIKALPTKFDRYAPTDIAFICNAEALINMAHKRLCSKASKETREIFNLIKEAIVDCDVDLANHLVPQCIYRGGICPEPKCCGFNKTDLFRKTLEHYKSLFV